MDKRREWFGLLVDIGCIVCRNEFGVISPPDIHHIHRNSRRVDDFHTIPLCPQHHRSGIKNAEYVSRHPWKKEFEKLKGQQIVIEEISKNDKIINFKDANEAVAFIDAEEGEY